MLNRILQIIPTIEPTYALIETDGRAPAVLPVHGWALVADIAGRTSTCGLVAEQNSIEPLVLASNQTVNYADAERMIALLVERLATNAHEVCKQNRNAD